MVDPVLASGEIMMTAGVQILTVLRGNGSDPVGDVQMNFVKELTDYMCSYLESQDLLIKRTTSNSFTSGNIVVVLFPFASEPAGGSHVELGTEHQTLFRLKLNDPNVFDKTKEFIDWKNNSI